MAIYFLLLTAFVCVPNVWADTFCLYVTDVCCDGKESTTSYTVVNGVDNIFFHYETGTPDDAVTIRVTIDGFDVFSESFCGCGNKTYVNRIGPGHVITIHALCEACNQNCTISTAKVWARTGSITCGPSCEGSGPGE
jgi:hypothetical protein